MNSAIFLDYLHSSLNGCLLDKCQNQREEYSRNGADAIHG